MRSSSRMLSDAPGLSCCRHLPNSLCSPCFLPACRAFRNLLFLHAATEGGSRQEFAARIAVLCLLHRHMPGHDCSAAHCFSLLQGAHVRSADPSHLRVQRIRAGCVPEFRLGGSLLLHVPRHSGEQYFLFLNIDNSRHPFRTLSQKPEPEALNLEGPRFRVEGLGLRD